MSLRVEDIALSYVGVERQWLQDLEHHARQTGRPIESVFASAAIDQYRASRELAEGFEAAQATVRKLAREIRELKSASSTN